LILCALKLGYLMAATASVAVTRPLEFSLGREGDILAWLVSGPFPDPGAFQLKGVGFNREYSVEKATESREFDTVAGPPESDWHLATGDRARGLDLLPSLGTASEQFAYCATDLVADRNETVQLLFGSDDGAKVFLDGVQVFSEEAARGIRRDEDRVELHLRQGKNHLLFKVEQLNQGWGLMARVVALDGRPFPGLNEELQIQPGLADPYRLLRKFAGKPGVLDLEHVQENLQVVATATHWLTAFRSRALDPGRLDRALRQARVAREISDDATHISSAMASLSSAVERAYEHSRSSLLAWAQSPGQLWPGSSAGEDFIRVMPGGRYFAHSNGVPFTPVGYNHNPDWTELSFGNPLADHPDPARVDRWFKNLKEHGVDLIRLMAETPQSGNLEERPGLYRPEQIIWLDTVFSAARKYGVRLWITPYDTFWMNRRADASPYWSANGGPVVKPIDFLTKPAVIDLQKRRMKFLIDRYGNSGTVFAWEIMNEIDLWWGASPEQIKSWTDQMAPFVRAYQRKRWGKDHLITMSFGTAEPTGLNADTAFRRKDLDFATMHLYLGASRAPNRNLAWKAARDYGAGVLYARSQVLDNRPVVDGESGPIDHWIVQEETDDFVFDLMSWTHLLTGGAGAGTRWPYRNPHHLTPGMLDTLRAIRVFSDGVPWKRLTGREVWSDIHVQDGRGALFATDDAAIIWMRGRNSQLLVFWNGSARYRYRVFNVATGTWSGPAISASGVDQVLIRLRRSAFSVETAIWIERSHK
jgi:hypothetical protein